MPRQALGGCRPIGARHSDPGNQYGRHGRAVPSPGRRSGIYDGQRRHDRRGIGGSTEMTDKTSFTPEEWRQLLRSLSLAGVAVTAASPSGPIGVVKEMFAAGKIVARARTEAASNELIKAVAADLATPEGRAQATEGMETDFAGASPDQIKARAIEALRRAAAIVDAK